MGATRNRRQTRRLYHTLTLLGVGCLVTLLVALFQPFSSINLWLSDQLFTPESPSPNIVIAGIDDDTLEAYGRWAEWPRSLHVQAINNLVEAGARVIGFDILFADSSPDDQILAAAMESAQNVVLPLVGTEPLPPAGSQITYSRFLSPVAPLEQASINVGHANIVPDPDGTVRRLPLVVRDSAGQSYPAFSLAVLHALFSMPLPQEYPLEDGTIYALARDIPVEPFYSLRINFAPEAESRPYISYGDVIEGDFDPSAVNNKIVLIGMTATGELDTWAVPTSANKVSGVLIHATAMDTILTQRFLVETGIGSTIILMLLLVGITAFTLPRLKLRWGAAITGGLFLGYLIASFLAFDRGYIIDMLYPLVTLPILYVSSVICSIVIEQSDRRLIKDLFGRYVSPQVAGEILGLADVGELELGGEQREVTVLFADIRGFTRMSEEMSPEAVVNMLNIYLSVMIDKVLQNDGMVNKFAGDNIMAVWNAPYSQESQAQLAVRAAWEAQEEIVELQQRDPSLPKVQFGIGINTGEAVAGNVGSLGRAEYTVIGDAVNLASRICSAALGGEVWIGPETYRQATDYLQVEELEAQTFKGKIEKVVVYRVVGWR